VFTNIPILSISIPSQYGLQVQWLNPLRNFLIFLLGGSIRREYHDTLFLVKDLVWLEIDIGLTGEIILPVGSFVH
jgi:hypothetical protein